jgi:hypothetical protein
LYELRRAQNLKTGQRGGAQSQVDADSTQEPELTVSDAIDALIEQVSGPGGMGQRS